MTIKSYPYVHEYCKEIPFYKKPIEKPKIKRLKKIDLLSELPFYKELSIIKKIMHLKDMQRVLKLKLSRKKI